MRAIKNSLNIDDTYTKLYRRPQLKASEQTHVKDNAFLQPDYNYQADVLHLPTDSFGFCKLLVVVDLANKKLEMEKMKDSESSEETLRALNRMLKRGIMKIPKASLTTDGGSGFKGVFHKFLYAAMATAWVRRTPRRGEEEKAVVPGDTERGRSGSGAWGGLGTEREWG